MSVSGRVEIAGGGLAGMVAAVALRRLGCDVTLHEQSPDLRAEGAGIFLGENGVRVLDAIDVTEEATRRAERIASVKSLDHRGRCLLSSAFRGDGQRLYWVLRGDLYQALVGAAIRSGVDVRTGSVVEGSDAAGALLLRSGETRSADLVIGADGIGSRVRDSLGIRVRVTDLHNTTQRQLLSLEFPEAPPGQLVNLWSGTKRLGLARIGGGKTAVYWSCPAGEISDPARPMDPATWAAAFPRLANVIEQVAAQPTTIRPISQVRCRPWSEGRVVLIGDAAHAMAPHIGQGGSTAMQAALVLAGRLATLPDLRDQGELGARLAAWEADVRPLVTKTQRFSRLYCEMQDHWPRPLEDLRSLAFVALRPAVRKIHVGRLTSPEIASLSRGVQQARTRPGYGIRVSTPVAHRQLTNGRLEDAGLPVVFPATPRAPSSDPRADQYRCELVGIEDFQQEAVVTEVSSGKSWRAAADEGDYMPKGTGLAPAPLMYWGAGVHGDLVARLAVIAREFGLAGESLSVVVRQGFGADGSFLRGDAVAAVSGARIEVARPDAVPEELLRELVETAAARSPAVAVLRSSQPGVFALYTNASRSRVEGVAASAAPDEVPPRQSDGWPPRPRAGDDAAPPLATRIPSTATGPPEQVENELRTRHTFDMRAVGGFDRELGLVRSTVGFLTAKGHDHQWTLLADPANERAPSPPAYFALGTAFCLNTQLSRYVDVRGIPIAELQLVQTTAFDASPASTSGAAVETHVFASGAATEAETAALVRMAARTCYAHRALDDAIELSVALADAK